MQTATLHRLAESDEGTLGILTSTVRDPATGEERTLGLCTLEPPWRDNRVGMSCIPEGTYRCAKWKSPTFGGVYLLRSVPGRSYILIHWGNWAGDEEKGLYANTDGCILVGLRFTRMVPTKKGKPIPGYGPQDAVASSNTALDRLHRHFGDEPFDLSVVRDPIPEERTDNVARIVAQARELRAVAA